MADVAAAVAHDQGANANAAAPTALSWTFDGTAPSTNVSTWNAFDYTQKHKNVGGFAEVTPGVDSPFYFRVTGNRKKTEGIRPLGQAGGSPGGTSGWFIRRNSPSTSAASPGVNTLSPAATRRTAASSSSRDADFTR